MYSSGEFTCNLRKPVTRSSRSSLGTRIGSINDRFRSGEAKRLYDCLSRIIPNTVAVENETKAKLHALSNGEKWGKMEFNGVSMSAYPDRLGDRGLAERQWGEIKFNLESRKISLSLRCVKCAINNHPGLDISVGWFA